MNDVPGLTFSFSAVFLILSVFVLLKASRLMSLIDKFNTLNGHVSQLLDLASTQAGTIAQQAATLQTQSDAIAQAGVTIDTLNQQVADLLAAAGDVPAVDQGIADLDARVVAALPAAPEVPPTA